MLVTMPMVVIMIMFVAVVVVLVMVVTMVMMMIIFMFAMLAVVAAKPHMHLYTLNATALPGLAIKKKLILKTELCELGFQVVWADPKVDHGGKVHVAADSGKAVVIKNLHKTPVNKMLPGNTRLWQARLSGYLPEWQYKSFVLHKK